MKFFTKHLTTTQMIVLSFLVVILIGAFLLQLPIAASDGQVTSFIDALFMSTSSVCITGLVVVDTATYWSVFGHVVILILMQIGGLGVITMTTTVMILLGKKLSLKNRMLLGDAFNLETLKGLVQFLQKAFKGTFLVEGIGALCYMPVFIPEYGAARGIWYSVFHSVSAFCNAGIQILGEDGFAPYVNNIWINVVTITLIFLGGIGFVVWLDVLALLKRRWHQREHNVGEVISLTLHSKIAISMSLGLIVVGTILFFAFEFGNSKTIGKFSTGNKLLAAFFQSVTCRTAGITMIAPKYLTIPSVIIVLFFISIGGSPIGTAGGMKTTTIAALILAVSSTIKGQEDVICFKRRIPWKTVRKALSIVTISLMASVVAIIAMLVFEKGTTMDIVFEVYNALSTAGFTMDYTKTVGIAGKVILGICMYLGRIGPITMVIAITMKETKSAVRLPEENITVG